ncbi:hypothetical protein ACLI4Q_19135 [Natrialbaceae archaeon A-CW1-1]
MNLTVITPLLVETRTSEGYSGTADSGPFAEQQRLFKLLSQDTCHPIIQELLGHPAHLMSLAKFEHMTGKSQAAIKDQLETLTEAGILACYTHEPSEEKRDLPSKFYRRARQSTSGLDPEAVHILHIDNVADNDRRGNTAQRRNEAFVALTRTRSWCTISGSGPSTVFDELEEIVEEVSHAESTVTFPAPNPRELERELESDSVTTLFDWADPSTVRP